MTVYKEEITPELKEQIMSFPARPEEEFVLNEHPWQLIYKQLALFYYHQGAEAKYYKNALSLALNCIQEPNYTIKLINHVSKLEFARREQKEELMDQILAKLEREIKQAGQKEREVFAD